MRPQQSGPIFNMGVDVMTPAFNLGPQYRVTMLTREDWTKGTGVSALIGRLRTSDFNRCENRGSECRSWREAAH